jgi:hypothetical protein
MTLEEYVLKLEPHVDSALVYAIEEWSNDTKLYMYLHNIQLAYMADFKKMLLELKNER